jgi:pimeloyl-ACP methyl ester carboxylesterase
MNEARFRQAEQRLWQSVDLAPTEQRAQLKRTGVTVRIQEVGEGPVVVFLHGVSNSGVSWATLAAQLEGFRCVLLDRPGCGLSDPLPQPLYSAERLAACGDALVVDVLDALGVDRAHVVATSYGGYFALRAAAAHPDRIDRIVEFGWMLGAPTNAIPLMLRMGSIRGAARLASLVPPTERSVRYTLSAVGLRRALATGRFSQLMVQTYLSLLRDTNTMRNELRDAPRGFPLRGGSKIVLSAEILGAIRSPCLFLWGEEDALAGAATAADFVHQIPGAQLTMIPKAGHAVWIDEPQHTALATEQFLRGTSASMPRPKAANWSHQS